MVVVGGGGVLVGGVVGVVDVVAAAVAVLMSMTLIIMVKFLRRVEAGRTAQAPEGQELCSKFSGCLITTGSSL